AEAANLYMRQLLAPAVRGPLQCPNLGTVTRALYFAYSLLGPTAHLNRTLRGRNTMSKAAPLFVVLLAAAITASAFAADDPAPAKAPTVAPDSTTEGSVTVGGQKIAYQAIAGTITVG